MANQQRQPPDQEPGLVDPRHPSPAPAEPGPGAGRPLEVEPLPGPTEASTEDAPADEPGGEGLVDPRFLMPATGPPRPASEPTSR
jgi:hypothetical protein